MESRIKKPLRLLSSLKIVFSGSSMLDLIRVAMIYPVEPNCIAYMDCLLENISIFFRS